MTLMNIVVGEHCCCYVVVCACGSTPKPATEPTGETLLGLLVFPPDRGRAKRTGRLGYIRSETASRDADCHCLFCYCLCVCWFVVDRVFVVSGGGASFVFILFVFFCLIFLFLFVFDFSVFFSFFFFFFDSVRASFYLR